MRLGLFIAFISLSFAAKAQTQLDTLEGWWTMQDSQHYFEDDTLIKVKFVGEEVLGMEDFYAAMVPKLGLPLQVIITAKKNEEFLEVYTLIPSPEGCDD
tara:strand:- start:546 stop:842 length:297 start_codon:yes stop_codon:yes gene_type:complete